MTTAALVAGQERVVAALSGALVSPAVGRGAEPAALAAIAGKAVKRGLAKLGRVIGAAAEEE